MNVTNYHNLFADFINLTEAQVAPSNKWYRTMPKGSEVREFYAQDLRVTNEHVHANIDDSLLSKCLETCLGYDGEEQGGPLLLKVMLDKVQSTMTSAVNHMLATIKGLRIKTP
jgi:hypothetical protein